MLVLGVGWSFVIIGQGGDEIDEDFSGDSNVLGGWYVAVFFLSMEPC